MQLQSAVESQPARAVAKVLVVDDDTSLLSALSELLAGEGYEVATATTAEEALERFREETYHLVLCDLQLPGRNGIVLLKALHEACPASRLVLITGHGSIRSAVTALKRGACEYMIKPIKPKRLLALCATLTARLPEYLPNQMLAADRTGATRFDGLSGRSRAMRAVFERVRLAASADTSVLVLGESGTGKELASRSIHRRSARGKGPFVAVRTATIPQEQLGAELFGVERGASSPERLAGKVEAAENGTLFLDEVSTLDERAQVALLRLLETGRHCRIGARRERAANVRVVAASNRDLAAMVAGGTLREDLYLRLSVFSVRLPPLRDRADDVPLLASEFLEEFSRKYGKGVACIPPETERLLTAHSWPGNVRELRNVIEQAVLLANGRELLPALLPRAFHRQPQQARSLTFPIGMRMNDIEREVILRTLEAHGGNKTVTAEVLGISRRSIYNKLAEYQLRGAAGR